eukprot:SAG31_NODE_1959_length_6808_cov_2.925771_5_plen_70_part_00
MAGQGRGFRSRVQFSAVCVNDQKLFGGVFFLKKHTGLRQNASIFPYYMDRELNLSPITRHGIASAMRYG